MKKKDIVKDGNYFNRIIKEGRFIKNNYYVIYIMKKKEQKPNFGFAVGKKLGNAVVRNKIKRQLRNIVTENISLFPLYNDYIIVAKKSCTNEKYDTLNKEMNYLVKRRLTL